jgi:DNA segregation ATPase FtsK/SpoIIIE, S-DNA-T family
MVRKKKKKRKIKSKKIKSSQKRSKKRRLGERKSDFILPSQVKQKIISLIMILSAVIIGLSFFSKAGIAGEKFMEFSIYFFGKTVFTFPLFLVMGGLVFWEELTIFKKNGWLAVLAIFVFILSLSGILGIFGEDLGGLLGYWTSRPVSKFFGDLVALIIFIGLSGIASIVIFYPLYKKIKEEERKKPKKEKLEREQPEKESRLSFIKEEVLPKFKIRSISSRNGFSENRNKLDQKKNIQEQKELTKEKTEDYTFSPDNKKYNKPPLDLLGGSKEEPQIGNIKENQEIIKKTLSDFNVPVEMGSVNIGPTVTQYSLKPYEGIKLSKITSLSDDLALSLAAHPIRIEAPIPGKSLVGIEVPNSVRAKVRLKDLLGSSEFQESNLPLNFALGEDVAGESVYADLARMPHLLVAGSTGSGKTVFLNDLILSLLYKNSPEFLKLILIDPKRVEFPVYNKLPHLLGPVICNNSKAVNALSWLVEEMERRFDILSGFKTKNLDLYNSKALSQGKKPLPYIVLIIDELADLMAAEGREVESLIVRLAQMARAVGIHLVVATQRPSVEVITGLIKANITSRVAFQVASQVDSRTVFDTSGAEKLLGRGDLLFISSQVSKPKRVQAALVSENEVKKIVSFIVDNNEITEDSGLEESFEVKLKEEDREEFDVFSRGEDALYNTAEKVVLDSGKASASFLQRRLQVGYARAARLIDMLEERGVVSPAQGAKPREVYRDKLIEDENKFEDNNYQD